MREIKFRAWDFDSKRLIYINHDYQVIFRDKFWHVRDIKIGVKCFDNWIDNGNVLMQYTGLKDKNGKEIYEGDIVLRQDLTPHYVITWINNSGGWFLVDGNMRMPISDIYSKKIIGNIYENPELLK